MTNRIKFKETDLRSVSNQQFYFAPTSLSMHKFEKELKKRKIEYLKSDSNSHSSEIIFSFFEKDIELATEAFDVTEKDSYDYFKRQKEKKRKQDISPKTRQKRIAYGLLLTIIIFILISLII